MRDAIRSCSRAVILGKGRRLARTGGVPTGPLLVMVGGVEHRSPYVGGEPWGCGKVAGVAKSLVIGEQYLRQTR